MITKEAKQKIVKAIGQRRANYDSDKKMSVFLGINNAQYSRIMRGELDNVVSDALWITIARKLDVQLNDSPRWVTAQTPMYTYVYSHLEYCQQWSVSGMLCDMPDTGKTYAARCYVKQNKNAVYIDCAQVKSRQRLIRLLAKEFGLVCTGRYSDVYEDLVFYLRSASNPFVVLDEAGDLDYSAFLELKALWNATEKVCGWYMMGADGLKAKIEANIGRKKVGYAEIFSRFGNRYNKVTPDGKEALTDFARTQVALIVRANDPKADVDKIYAKTGGSLRRIFTEIQKSIN